MLNSMKLGTRLTGGFLLVAVIALIIGIFGYFQLHKLDTADTKLYQQIAVPLGNLTKMSTDFQRLRVIMRGEIPRANGDKEKYSKLAGQISGLLESIDREAAVYEKTLYSDEGKKLFAEYKETRLAYAEVLKKLLGFASENKMDEYFEYMSKGAGGAGFKLEKAISLLVESKIKQGKILSESNVQLAGRSGWIMLVLALAGALLAFFLGAVITRSITKPLETLAVDARMMAEGNLQMLIKATGNDEIGQLTAAFGAMAENLKDTIRQVAETASNVASASQQLSNTAEQLATGTEEMACQASTVATASEEMSATSSSIAQNCHQAADSSSSASQAASAGSAVVSASIAIMEQIAERVQSTAETVKSLGDRSDQIGAIVATIEDIADQTNLLALNAAIEAARAGEQGRGFAVVADEVRALAERTTRATKEISAMIKSIQTETQTAVKAMEQGVTEVGRGTLEASRSGEALQHILLQINEVTMQVNQIATAAEEQTATTNEIANNIVQISEVVQETSHGIHDSAAAAEGLSKMAERLQILVQRFKL